jgi:hypothetical protein
MYVGKVFIKNGSRANLGPLLTQLAELGVPVDLEVIDTPSGDLEILVAGSPESSVVSLPSGVAGNTIWLRFIAMRRVTLVDCEITVKWDDRITLSSHSERGPFCRLGGLDVPERKSSTTELKRYCDSIIGVTRWKASSWPWVRNQSRKHFAARSHRLN